MTRLAGLVLLTLLALVGADEKVRSKPCKLCKDCKLVNLVADPGGEAGAGDLHHRGGVRRRHAGPLPHDPRPRLLHHQVSRYILHTTLADMILYLFRLSKQVAEARRSQKSHQNPVTR